MIIGTFQLKIPVSCTVKGEVETYVMTTLSDPNVLYYLWDQDIIFYQIYENQIYLDLYNEDPNN